MSVFTINQFDTFSPFRAVDRKYLSGLLSINLNCTLAAKVLAQAEKLSFLEVISRSNFFSLIWKFFSSDLTAF